MKCPVRVTLDTASDSIISIRGEHNHDSDILKEWVKEKTKEVVAAAVANPSVAPRTAFKDLTNHVLNSADTSPAVTVLPKQKTMARFIQLKRKLDSGAPGKLPTTWEDYKVLENYVKTADGEPFLIMDEELEGSVGKV